jgi:CheY-like chemotaxis protein
MSTGRKTLLCIDDHRPSLAGWCLYLQGAGYSVETAYGAQEGLQLFATRPIDLVLLDYAMPEADGGEVAATMKRIKPQVRIVMFSGLSEIPQDARAHVDAFLQKGLNPSLVLQTIDQLLHADESAA